MMIHHDELVEGDRVEWEWEGSTLAYEFSMEDVWRSESLVDFACYLPSLEAWIRENTGNLAYRAAYVRLTE